jgi:hypothetical protein
MAKRKGISFSSDLGFLASEAVLKNLAFVLFLGFLATIYIANTHYAERNVRRIQSLQKEIKDMRWYYMSLLADNMYNSKRSEMIQKASKDGLFPQMERPRKIVVK